MEKGQVYFDRKERTIAYVLEKGFGSGKTLQVSLSTETAEIVTPLHDHRGNI